MNKIVINPHHCSQEEYDNLIEHLNNECWDYEIIDSNMNELKTVKASFDKIICMAEDLIEKLPKKGNTSSDCQRIALRLAINGFIHVVNGIEENDLIPNEDD
jgi:hypothetical protein